MDPLTATLLTSNAAVAGEATAVTVSITEASATSDSVVDTTGATEVNEAITGEILEATREAIIGQRGLLEQVNMIKLNSIEFFAVKNESAIKEVSQIEKNREAGAAREENVEEELKKEHLEDEGYTIEKEVYLRDENGKIVRDPVTGEARRLDFVVVKDGQVVKSVEVTSESAPKSKQSEKEDRIRGEGGNYIRDSNGQLIPFAPGVKTEIIRRP